MQGVVYVAYGDNAERCLFNSLASLKATNPGLDAAVITDRQIDGVRCIHRRDDHVGARLARFDMVNLSPFEKTCYLDADTSVIASLEPGFHLLDAFDLALAVDGKYTVHYVAQLTNRSPFHRDEVRATVSDVGTPMVTLHNCGMMFFKPTDVVKRLFATWREEWERFRGRDQLAFVRALNRNPVRMMTLPHHWNTGYAPKAEVILHNWGEARREGAP